MTDRCPMVTEPPCPGIPVPAQLVVTDANGATVTTMHTSTDGRFHINLKPGTYTLRAVGTGALARAATMTVNVRSGQMVTITVRLDSGIR